MKKLTLFMTCIFLLTAGLYAQNALHFNNDSTRDYVIIPNAAALNLGTGRFTMEAVIKMSNVQTSFPTILSNRINQSTSPGFSFFIDGGTGRLAFQIGGVNTLAVGTNLIKNDSCHHVAVVRDSTGRITGYVDGVAYLMAAVNNGNMSNTHALWMGLDDPIQNFSQFFGRLDEVRIWNIVRTAAEINAYRNTTVSPSSSGLIAYYQFNHGVANGNNTSPIINTLSDLTGHGHNGTLQSGFALNGTVSNWVPSCIMDQSPCDFFELAPLDSNCCNAGIIRNLTGGNTVESVSYSVIGGVVLGYTTDCVVASPASSSGTSGTISFDPDCSNMQLFNTALQNTDGTGNMMVTYVIHFINGDSCTYTTDVSCWPAPHTQCDSVNFQLCICEPSAQQSYFNINIQNQNVPNSPICAVRVAKYNTSNNLQTWNSGFFIGGTAISNPNANITSPSDFGVINTNDWLNLQFWFNSSQAATDYIVVTIIHCNGDTCIEIWKPQVVPSGDVGFTDFNIGRGVNPFPKLFAYTFKVTGPSKTYSGNSPYKIKYITLSIKDTADTAGKTEIAALTGAEMYSEKGRWERLKFSLASHGRYNALFQFQNPLDLKSKDSSGVFQIIFANALPKEILYNCYGTSGSVLSSGTLTLDTGGSIGIVKLGKTNQNGEGLMIFNGFPTPTNGQFNIKLNLPENDNVAIHVFDINGKEVLVKSLGLLNNGLSDGNIDLSALETGNYFINAVSQKNGGVSNTIKVVLMK